MGWLVGLGWWLGGWKGGSRVWGLVGLSSLVGWLVGWFDFIRLFVRVRSFVRCQAIKHVGPYAC